MPLRRMTNQTRRLLEVSRKAPSEEHYGFDLVEMTPKIRTAKATAASAARTIRCQPPTENAPTASTAGTSQRSGLSLGTDFVKPSSTKIAPVTYIRRNCRNLALLKRATPQSQEGSW